MKRFPDWQLRLEAFVRAREGVPFKWGENDCALFAAGAVEAITGEVVCEELRGHADVRDAVRVLQEVGGVRGLGSRALGEPISVLLANVGDVVVVSTGKREMLAVCNGTSAIGPGPAGIVAVSMQQALAAWRVG